MAEIVGSIEVWAKLVAQTLARDTSLLFKYSAIRPVGTKLAGCGCTSSADIQQACERISNSIIAT